MRLPRLCMFIIIFMLIVIPSYSQDDNTLFEATFDDGIIPATLNIQYGTYEIVDNSLAYTVQNGGFLVIPAGVAWTDYAIEMRLQIMAGSVWLQARTGGDLCSGYYLTINPTLDSYDLSSADRDCNFTVLQMIESANIPDDWITARIEVQGDQIRAYIDDELLMEVTDNGYAFGYPTINVFPVGNDQAQVAFDFIRIIDLTLPEIAIEVTPEVTSEPANSAVETTPDPAPGDVVEVNEIPLNDDPEQMVATLKELELIPAGDGQLHHSDSVAISRVGSWFEPIMEEVSADHVVMSGYINFLPYADAEACLLSARITRDEIGVAFRYLDVGLNARNEVFIGETTESGEYSQATQDGLLNQPEAAFLFIAHGGRLSVYVNGRAVFQNIEVTAREGMLGVSSIATTSFTVCRISDVWAYTFEDSATQP